MWTSKTFHGHKTRQAQWQNFYKLYHDDKTTSARPASSAGPSPRVDQLRPRRPSYPWQPVPRATACRTTSHPRPASPPTQLPPLRGGGYGDRWWRRSPIKWREVWILKANNLAEATDSVVGMVERRAHAHTKTTQQLQRSTCIPEVRLGFE